MLSLGEVTKAFGFHHEMIRWCTLHTLHLGVVNWAAGSAFHMLLSQDSEFFLDRSMLNSMNVNLGGFPYICQPSSRKMYGVAVLGVWTNDSWKPTGSSTSGPSNTKSSPFPEYKFMCISYIKFHHCYANLGIPNHASTRSTLDLWTTIPT